MRPCIDVCTGIGLWLLVTVIVNGIVETEQRWRCVAEVGSVSNRSEVAFVAREPVEVAVLPQKSCLKELARGLWRVLIVSLHIPAACMVRAPLFKRLHRPHLAQKTATVGPHGITSFAAHDPRQE